MPATPAKLLDAARAAEHEYLLSIPMEPQGFPLNDPGKQALMTNLSVEQNRARLDWMLSRIAGYAGAVGAEGSLRGERFASLPDQINPVLAELSRRGLLYVDPRPDAAPLPLVWSRSVDLVVDEPGAAADIDDKLAQLAQTGAREGQRAWLRRDGAAGHHAAPRRLGERAGGGWPGARPGQRPGAGAGGTMSRAALSAECRRRAVQPRSAGCSSRDVPTCRMRKGRPAAGNCRRAASIRTRTRAPPCCANWRKRSAPTAPRSSASIPSG